MSSITYAARPTIRIDGQEYPLVSELVLGFEMCEQEGGMSSLELRLSNIVSNTRGGANLAFDDGEVVNLGARLTLYAGDETSPTEIFQGVITGLEADFEQDQPPELLVLAEDIFQQARLERRTQTYEDTTVADLVDTFAGRLGLTPVITGFDSQVGTQVQLNESDLAFMRRIIARFDGDMQVVGEELHVSPRADVQRGALELAMHDELRRARVTVDLAHQSNGVTVTGWDAAQGQRIDVTSNGVALGPGRGTAGAQVLRDALTERNFHVAHMAVNTEEEAQAVADTVFASRARRFACVEATAEGDATLRVGAHVTLTGLGSRYDNTYYVTRAVHRWDVDRGYETDFDAECAYWDGA